MEGDTLYVVQTRDITSLFPLSEPRPEDNGLHVYISINYIQMMPDDISRLGLDIFRNILTQDQEARLNSKYPYLPAAAGRIFADISGILQFKKGRDVFLL